MKKISFILILLIVSFFSCKNNDKNITPEILDLEKKISDGDQKQFVDQLNQKYLELLRDSSLTDKDKMKITDHAYNFFKKEHFTAISSNYLYEFLKNFKSGDSKEKIKEFIAMLDKDGNKELSVLMKRLYKITYQDDKSYIAGFDKLSSSDIDFDLYLKSVSEKMYKNMEISGSLDLLQARNYINSCEIYALINPENHNSAKYLFMGAQVAQNIKMFEKTVELFDWILKKYPDFKKTESVLFIKGFVLDNELKRTDEARKVYNEFLKKYPKSDYADDVKTSLEYLGMSNDEIIKSIENKGKK
jgi:tetratricopeptide (TPR) repeat protein